MGTLRLFYLESCPYCVKARRALKELVSENSAYQALLIDWIEESREPALAESYDYYYVPTVFLGDEKLYEASPSQDYASIKASLRAALDRALAG